MIPSSLPGLDFLVIAFATFAIGVVGAVVQTIAVLARRFLAEPARRRSPGTDALLALAGPMSAVAIGGLTVLFYALVLDGEPTRTQIALDAWAPALPISAIAIWIAVHAALVIRARRR